jgi:tetratricopeptide (TPR) repeat protein
MNRSIGLQYIKLSESGVALVQEAPSAKGIQGKMNTALILFLFMVTPGIQLHGDLSEAIRFYERGEFNRAVNLLTQLRNSHPTDPEPRFWLGKSFIKTRQWDNAVREMEQAVNLQPSNARYHLWLGRACGARASHSIFITAIRWAGRVAKEFETAKKLAPEDLEVRFDLLEFYLHAPGMLGGGMDKAGAEAKAISKIDPQKGYTARSSILRKNKQWDMARKELIQATIDFPYHADSWKDLAEYLLERQEFENALNYGQRSQALESKSKGVLLVIAASRIRLKRDLDQAVGILEALAIGSLGDNDPAFEEVYYWLGEGFLAKGDKIRAREAFSSALRFDPDYAGARDGISHLD